MNYLPLWKKCDMDLVQEEFKSVAVKIIVDRENEIRAFVPESIGK